MKINNIFSTLKNLQLSKDKLLLILLGGVLLVIISLPVKGKTKLIIQRTQGIQEKPLNTNMQIYQITQQNLKPDCLLYYRRLMGRERLPSLSPSRIRERL